MQNAPARTPPVFLIGLPGISGRLGARFASNRREEGYNAKRSHELCRACKLGIRAQCHKALGRQIPTSGVEMSSAGTGSSFDGKRGEFSSGARKHRPTRVPGRLVLTVTVGLLLSAFLVACGGGFFVSPALNTVYIDPPAPAIATSGTAQLVAYGRYADGSQNVINADKVSWSSSDDTIATVTSPGGLVTGVAVGTATITATTTGPSTGCHTLVSIGPPIQLQQVCGGAPTVTGTVTVSVTATSMHSAVITTTRESTVQQTTATISGAPQTLQFFAYGNGDASNDVTQAVTWTSSNPSVAKISSGLPSGNGLATSVAAGTTNITATTTNTNSGQVVNSQTIVLTVQ